MTYLQFTTEVGEVFTRAENDDSVIAKLISLGWVEVEPPSPPEPDARETARAALRASWANQPSWIRGPFDSHFRAAQVFLDAGDDDAARDLIAFAEAPGAYTTEQLSTFAAVKTAITTAIAALPPL